MAFEFIFVLGHIFCLPKKDSTTIFSDGLLASVFSANKLYYMVLPSFFCIQLFPTFFHSPGFFRVQVFQSPGFSGFRFFRVQVFQGPDFLGSRFFWVQVFKGPGPGSGSRFQKQPFEHAIILKCVIRNPTEKKCNHTRLPEMTPISKILTFGLQTNKSCPKIFKKILGVFLQQSASYSWMSSKITKIVPHY